MTRFHRQALTIALLVGVPAALLRPLSGDLSARVVARTQPATLAAMEGQFRTERGAPLRIGGWSDEARRETRYAIEIPRALSLLAFQDPDAEVLGLEAFPRENWPPVAIVHVAFQVMVALVAYLAAVGLWVAWLAWRRRDLARARGCLRALILAAPPWLPGHRGGVDRVRGRAAAVDQGCSPRGPGRPAEAGAGGRHLARGRSVRRGPGTMTAGAAARRRSPSPPTARRTRSGP